MESSRHQTSVRPTNIGLSNSCLESYIGCGGAQIATHTAASAATPPPAACRFSKCMADSDSLTCGVAEFS
jgi:hypothetical protein